MEDSRFNDLKKLLKDSILSKNSADLEAYKDISYPDSCTNAALIVRPKTYKDVQKLVKYCNKSEIPLILWGGGTNLCGALKCEKEHIILDLKSLNKVLDFPPDNQTIKVQAGITIEKMDNYLKKQNFRFGHDPWSRESATVGGSIALDAAGNLYQKFGSIGDLLLSLKVLLADGNIVNIGKNVSKSSASPKLTSLFVGSSGLFGIILEAEFAVHPLPKDFKTLGFAFSSFTDCFESLCELEKNDLFPDSFIAGTIPPEILKLQKKSEQILAKLLSINAGLFLYFEDSEKILEGAAFHNMQDVLKILKKKGRKLPPEHARDWWERRNRYFETTPQIVEKGLSIYVFDLCIPKNKILKTVDAANRIALKFEIEKRIAHSLFSSLDSYAVALYIKESEGKKLIKKFEKELFKVVFENGGSITRTHGLGTIFDAETVERELGDELILLGKLKEIFDPKHIFNPGLISRRI